MTALQQTLFTCNRCNDSDTMPINDGPVERRMAGPAGWMMFATAIGQNQPPMHFCPKCASEFIAFMAGAKGLLDA